MRVSQVCGLEVKCINGWYRHVKKQKDVHTIVAKEKGEENENLS